MRIISFNLFIRALAMVSLVVGLVGGVGLVPHLALADVQPSCSATATQLFTNGDFITRTGDEAGGNDTSSPPSGYQGLGFLADPTRTQSVPVPSGSPTRARLADDFIVTGNGWRPSAITFYAYQTDATTPTSTITGVVDLRLWDGPPGVVTSTVIAGPVAGPITPIRNEWTGVYRTYLEPAFGETEGLTSTRRPIMAVTISWPFTVTTLVSGTYWIEWGMAGDTNFSGPWVPAVSFSPTNNNANARQLDLSNGEPGTWAPRVDYNVITATVELPFVICGERIPTPQITSLNPAEATVGGGNFTLTVNGSGFIDGTGSDRSVVYWNGSPRATTYISSTQLTATILASDIATTGTANVTVVNPGNITSSIRQFAINNPAPTISAISPFTAVAGDPGFTLTITGTGFVPSSVVRWNGTDLPTSFSSSTVLTATVPAERIAAAGTANVTVFNPGPGG
ncbi:MAG: IPT/TIG domain-containing protein, partial [Roseiflexus sp.]|nr:IPT/TIG domain-containing protein [Roseiflexus sp.]